MGEMFARSNERQNLNTQRSVGSRDRCFKIGTTMHGKNTSKEHGLPCETLINPEYKSERKIKVHKLLQEEE